MTLLLPDILLVVLAALVMGYDLYKGNNSVSSLPFHLSWVGLCGIFVLLLCLPYDQNTVALFISLVHNYTSIYT